MNKIKLQAIIVCFSAIIINSCSQLKEMATLTKCQFKLKSVENISLAGVNIQNLTNFSQLNLIDAAKITSAVANGTLPLSFVLNVEAKNPNPVKASMNKLEWILFIDDIEMINGILNKKIEIAPSGGISVFPILMQMDLKKILSGKSGDALLNFGFNLAGAGNKPTRITLKAKPSIMIGNSTITYPGYISINNEFTSK